jgi:hypothetical protein
MRFIKLFMERFGIAKGTEDVIEIAIWCVLKDANFSRVQVPSG